MKLTIGGSYHQPYWNEVCSLIKKLENAGHKVLAPGLEWEPINQADAFIKFRGEENKTAEELQKGFLNKIEQSDAFIICNPNSYQGMCVSGEFGYATALLLNEQSNLKQIYFNRPPLGYSIFPEMRKKGKRITEENFYSELSTNPKYRDAYKAYHTKSGFDFLYEDTLRLHCQMLFLQEKNLLTIGIGELLKIKER